MASNVLPIWAQPLEATLRRPLARTVVPLLVARHWLPEDREASRTRVAGAVACAVVVRAGLLPRAVVDKERQSERRERQGRGAAGQPRLLLRRVTG